MATLDFTGQKVDLRMKAGCDAVFTLTFEEDISAWSDFTATVIEKDGTEHPLAVDDAEQASDNRITLTLAYTETAVIPTGSKWQMDALDADGMRVPIAVGKANVQEDFTA